MIHVSRFTWESYEQGRVLITTIPLDVIAHIPKHLLLSFQSSLTLG